MIYRDDALAAEARVAGLRREMIALRSDGPALAARAWLRAEIRRERERGARALRALDQLRRGRVALGPRSLTELVVACALSSAALTLALGLVFVVLVLASIV